MRSPIDSGDQISRRSAAIALVGASQELLDVQRLSLARIERSDARINVFPKLAQLLDMREQFLADLFLIGIGEFCDPRDRLFQRLDHGGNIAHLIRVMSMNPPSSTAISSPEAILAFWREAGYDRWFTRDDAFDAGVRDKFLPTYEAAAAGKLSSWEATADGALALCIVLDQFPRNMFRGDARTYAADPIARGVANRALKRGYDQDIPEEMRGFFFLPFMHSEELGDQERCVQLYREAESADLKYAERHRDIVRRFGRFPHRNAILGRATTPEEQTFLDDGGFKG